jgi:anthranilate/para-aminobenzoate synthase component I
MLENSLNKSVNETSKEDKSKMIVDYLCDRDHEMTHQEKIDYGQKILSLLKNEEEHKKSKCSSSLDDDSVLKRSLEETWKMVRQNAFNRIVKEMDDTIRNGRTFFRVYDTGIHIDNELIKMLEETGKLEIKRDERKGLIVSLKIH